MNTPPSNPDSANLETVTLGSGCFWCTEAMFQNLRGVKSAVSGYSGGKTPNPTYEQVCTGTTGHAEVCQITYDPAKVSYEELLEVFWQTHDPTTLNRQGADRGTQYLAHAYAARLADRQARQSVGCPGTCWDNAVAESFFATLKTELLHRQTWATRQQARTAIFEYIEAFYNRQRRHSTLGYLSPADFEDRYHRQATAA